MRENGIDHAEQMTPSILAVGQDKPSLGCASGAAQLVGLRLDVRRRLFSISHPPEG
jgi:hypothetical protein